MDPLTVKAIDSIALSELSGLKPVLVLAVPPPNPISTLDATALSIKDLALDLFQQAIKATSLLPRTEQALRSLDFAQEATASMRAELNAPQPAGAPAPEVASNQTSSQTASQASGNALVTPSSSTTLLPTPPSVQDTLGADLSQDTALQMAQRFGVGVVAPTVNPLASTESDSDMVRDATAVPHLGNLQPHTGRPGHENFAHPQTPIQEILHDFHAIADTPVEAQVDLLG